jgi:8-oxo-dGTP pyrophosphatase MutT (NUDIX family)
MTFNFELIRSGLTAGAHNAHGEATQPLGCAAILVPLIKYNGAISLLLTQRAFHMRHHGGEVAFPGGMWEQGDDFPLVTALREAEEEVSLNPRDVNVLGLLPTVYTGNNTKVIPVVGVINSPQLSLVCNPAEIDSIFMIPLTELMSDRRVRTDVFYRRGEHSWAPAYHYQGYEIWGVTAGVIKELLVRCFKVEFPKEHHAPEKLWK